MAFQKSASSHLRLFTLEKYSYSFKAWLQQPLLCFHVFFLLNNKVKTLYALCNYGQIYFPRMKLKEIKRTAIQSWSPAKHHPIFLATGTSVQHTSALRFAAAKRRGVI